MNKKTNKNKISTTSIIALTSGVAAGLLFTMYFVQVTKTETLVVPAREITAYDAVLTKEDFTTIQVAKKSMKNFPDFIQDIRLVENKYANTTMLQGQPIKQKQLVSEDLSDDILKMVTKPNYRGIFLPAKASNVLEGAIKTGSIVDFYLKTTIDKPTTDNQGNKETLVIPFRAAYKIQRVIHSDNLKIFFEFPMEDSEKYVMLQQLLSSNSSLELVATAPNSIYDHYDGKTLSFDEFLSNVIGNTEYFYDEKSSNDVESNTNNTQPNTNENTNQ